MAGDIYLYLDGIPGESTSAYFYNWIDVLSFSLGVAMDVDQEARESASGGITSGQADPEDINIETKMSIASPVLMQCCAAGAIIPRGRLIQCNIVNAKRTIVNEYAFGDSIISNVSESASGGEIPNESISINYGSIIWRYNCFNHFNPTLWIGESVRGWSIVQASADKKDLKDGDNARNALYEIANCGKGALPEIDSDGTKNKFGAFPYSDFFSIDKVNFAPGPVIPHDPEGKKVL